MGFSALAKKLKQHYLQIQNKTLQPPTCFVGFDGFTDEIIKVVDKKLGSSQTFIATIKDFGKKILDASEKSCNFELVVKRQKLGGNAPILTNALVEGGHAITFAGTIGTKSKIEPLFLPFSKRCKKVIPLGRSGKTEALEFDDGKIILGKMESLNEITLKNIIEHIDFKILENIDLFVCANWTMVPAMTDIWEYLLKKLLPKFSKQKTRYLFVDLADPTKRSSQDLKKALKLLAKLQTYYEVILSVNTREAEIITQLFKLESTYKLFEKLQIARLLIHDRKFAIAIDKTGVLKLKSFYTKKPVLTTGGGDHFNAGYCNGLLYGLNKEETLMTALATAGFYVRQGTVPSIEELAKFLNMCYCYQD